jgi:sec-independent protein translocase protein TatB
MSQLCLRIAPVSFPHYDWAMSFSDSIFLFFLALLLFGPKKLPEIARQAGRILAELRRASNEFRSQIETEIAHLEAEKSRTALPPSQPAPAGTVASLGANPAAGETISRTPEPAATLAAPVSEAAVASEVSTTSAGPIEPHSSAESLTEVAVEPPDTVSQASHV